MSLLFCMITFSCLLGLALIVLQISRSERERWWQCDCCGFYHNEAGERSDVAPIELRGTMDCGHCINDMKKGEL